MVFILQEITILKYAPVRPTNASLWLSTYLRGKYLQTIKQILNATAYQLVHQSHTIRKLHKWRAVGTAFPSMINLNWWNQNPGNLIIYIRQTATSSATIFLFREKWSELTISFKENQFIPSRRSELYGVNDFIASCGGLLGLFLGVSILSIVEVIYYCTLRLGCALRQRRSNDNSIRVQKNAVAPAEPGTMIVTPTAAKKCHQN